MDWKRTHYPTVILAAVVALAALVAYSLLRDRLAAR